MELLLNLAWLLLALPAYAVWRCSRSGAQRNSYGSLQTLLALGCALALLFPVISATDDLHAMRAEVEESPASKRSVRQSTGDKSTAWNSRTQSSPALLAASSRFLPFIEGSELTIPAPCVLSGRPMAGPTGRAPPRPLSL